LVKREQTDEGRDYAVVKLSRPVTGHTPLNVRRQGNLEVNTPLFVVGHPAGLPVKWADGARVRSLKSTYFIANLDTYGGNSGSAIFNANTREVEGILVRGEADYTMRGECRISYRCGNDECGGEAGTFIRYALPYISN
jgi:V8-like Glu-specific endopeptidase